VKNDIIRKHSEGDIGMGSRFVYGLRKPQPPATPPSVLSKSATKTGKARTTKSRTHLFASKP